MGLSGALDIGRSGILTSQAALQVTGNNLANAATPGYHRQTAQLSPTIDQQIQQGVYVGTGVQIDQVHRQINQALESRLRTATADQSGSQVRQDLLNQVESIESSYSGSSLSDRLTTFFNQWSQLANNPQDTSQRNLVAQQGASLAQYIQGLRTQMTNLRSQTDQTIGNDVSSVNDRLTQIAKLNGQIAGQNSPPSSLMDQRDQLLGQVSKYLDISTIQQPDGATDVYVGSTPLVLGSTDRGLKLDKKNVNGTTQIQLEVKADNQPLNISSGSLGAAVAFRQQDLPTAISQLDTFTNQLIFQVNKIHSQGQGLTGITSTTSHNAVADPAAALNSSAAALPFTPTNGTFKVAVTDPATGQKTTTVVHVSLNGAPSDTSLNSLTTDLNAITGVNASVTTDGKLKISASGSDTLSFSSDSSGVLAALGVNSYFTGSDATNIAVSNTVLNDPKQLAISQNGDSADNSGALAMANLASQNVSELGGVSLSDYWSNHVSDIATQLSQAKQQNTANGVVQSNLEQQQQAVSGVNTNQEAINLMQNQQAFQASAKFISTVDQMMQTLIQMV